MAALKARLRQISSALRLGWLYKLWYRLASCDPRRLWRAARFRRWNRNAGPLEMVVRPGLRLLVDPQSREPFEWFCFRSVEMAQELDAFAREMAGRSRLLDVGACHGIFSLVFASRRPEARVVAVEPSPIAHAILAENLRLGKLDNVVAECFACGAGAGTLRMRQQWHHLEALPDPPPPAAAGTHGDAGCDDGEAGAVVAVPMRSLDDLCRELDFQPDLIKIDVEGFELAVLTGAQQTLARHRPHVFLEIHPRRLRELGGSVEEVVRLLEGLGYELRRLRGSPLGRRQVTRRESVSRFLCAAVR